MKVRWLSILVIMLAMVGMMALLAATAKADGGPHSQRTSLTNVSNCAECHRAHDAAATKLVVDATVYDLCTTCHGPTGETAENIVDGWYSRSITQTGPLKGGGFSNATMNVSWVVTAPVQAGTNSQHDVVGFGSYTDGTVWGFGAINATADPGMANFALNCSTCHDPHGGSGVGTIVKNGVTIRQPTYRILRSDLGSKLGVVLTPVTVPDTSKHQYYISSTVSDTVPYRYYGQKYTTGDETTATDNNLASTISDWCALCHTRVHADLGDDPANTSSGDAIYDFRHPTDGSNVSFNFNPSGAPVNKPSGGAPSCFTCHVSHGSTASFVDRNGNAIVEPYPGGTGQLDSTLLRMNGRGVCEACHNK